MERSPDAVTASPDIYTVLVDTTFARVLLAKFAPGQRDNWHSHPNGAFYILSGDSVRLHMPGGKSKTMKVHPGISGFINNPASHSAENLGSDTLRVLIFERKPGTALPELPEDQVAGAVEASPEQYTNVLDKDSVRVLRMLLPAGTYDKFHSHPNEAVYVISGGSVTLHVPGGDPMDMTPVSGATMIMRPTKSHSIENVGDTDIELVIFEIRK